MRTFRTAVGLTGGRVLLWSLLGRLPAAMCPIGSLLLVTDESGSVWRGAAVAGVLAVGQGVGGPLVGRLADRRGQRPVGLAAAAVNTLAILALVAGSVLGLALPVQLLAAALIGVSVPLVGPLSRSRWVRLARGDRESTAAALSLDGTVDEISFTAGPAVIGLLAALANPAAGMLLAAALVGVCATLFALHPSASPGSPAAARSTARLVNPPFALLLGGMALLGVCFGSVQVGVTATTEHLGHPGAAGLLYGLIGGVSSFAGVATAALPARVGLPVRLKGGTVLLLAASLLLPFADTMTALTVATGCLGAAVAPQMITMFGLAERTVPAERLGEAMAALVSSITLAQSAGTLAAGWAADHHGPAAPFLVTCTAAALALLLALTTATERRYRRRHTPAPPRPTATTAA
ncbi:MFS transporter [Kitasatospora paracochleata]|uniref:MFS family permease n=1 Tax=Kitasatospora paracochleata TaxID=58354 RepID=A0ABT1ITK6_9ACTN|nr:MFS transporter [Kitasatospora paracochleata]MCP2308457.1 MFS family permease [Kitasatospora paracochleata]